MSGFASLASLLAACVAGANTAPEQIHIALAGKDEAGASSGMRVAWFTQDLPEGESPSVVKFGTQAGDLTQTVSAEDAPTQYLEEYGYHHVVTLAGLSPSATYYYAVGSEAGGWSSEWSFKTAPSGEAAQKASISVSVFGDMGYLDSEQRPMELAVAGLVKHWSATVSRSRLEALKDGMDLVWHLGDIAYSDDAFAHSVFGFTYEECYNGFMNWMQNLSATMPYMVSVGNHEKECHSPACLASKKAKALGNFAAYNARWHMPSSESTGRDVKHSMWHSWNYGPVHFVSINTEEIISGTKAEYLQWLESDLKAAAEARASGAGPRWIVAGGHRPYGSVKKDHVPLFEKYGVDLYVAGHGHSYSRSAPVNGITYIMVGGAGCDEMNYEEPEHDSCINTGSEWVCEEGYAVPHGSEEFKSNQVAIGVLDADATSLKWRLVDSTSGEVLDQIELTGEARTVV